MNDFRVEFRQFSFFLNFEKMALGKGVPSSEKAVMRMKYFLYFFNVVQFVSGLKLFSFYVKQLEPRP